MLMSAVEGKPLPGLNTSLPPITAPLSAWPRSSNNNNNNHTSRRLLQREQHDSVSQSAQYHVLHPPSSAKTGVGGDSEIELAGESDLVHRAFQLERNLHFLREQHKLILDGLHAEVEELKAKNKALQMNLIIGTDLVARTDNLSVEDVTPPNEEAQIETNMEKLKVVTVEKGVMTDLKLALQEQQNNSSSTSSSSGANSASKIEMARVENQELRAALHDARNRNMYLVSLIEQIKRRHASDIQNKRPKPVDVVPPQTVMPALNEFPVMYAHKFEEYEEIIQQLRNDHGELQAELSRLKATLREVLSSNKWSPEAYMIARSVLQEGHHGRDHYHRLPRIPIRPPHEQPRRSSLPAIGQHGYNSVHPMRNQQTFPMVPQSKPRSNGSNSGRHDNRYSKQSSSHKRQQRSHVP